MYVESVDGLYTFRACNLVDAGLNSLTPVIVTQYLMLIWKHYWFVQRVTIEKFGFTSKLLFNWIQFPLVRFISRPWGKQIINMGIQTQQTFRDEEEEELPGRGTTLSGQSMSTSRSVGSPSSRSEQTMATPASDNTFLRLNNLDIHGDEAGSHGAVAWVLTVLWACRNV